MSKMKRSIETKSTNCTHIFCRIHSFCLIRGESDECSANWDLQPLPNEEYKNSGLLCYLKDGVWMIKHSKEWHRYTIKGSQGQV